jgi:hypothetical protein
VILILREYDLAVLIIAVIFMFRVMVIITDALKGPYIILGVPYFEKAVAKCQCIYVSLKKIRGEIF